MTDYTVLMQQLRDCVDCLCGECKYQKFQKPNNFVICMNHLVAEAADAIEELSEEVENLESMREISPETEYAIDKHADSIISHMDKLISELESKPMWISVTERLPEHGVHVLVACHVKWLGGGGRYYVCDAFHTEHFKDACSCNDDIDMEYNEDEDEYYFPEGWWEVIKNWDEYSCVAIEDFVTHWMPLPSTEGLNET